jgi:hypothetical protein
MADEQDAGARFLVLQRLCKIAGAPVTAEDASGFYKAYRLLVVASGYLTLLATFVGIVSNLHDMAYVMEAARPGFVMLDLIWMHFFIRYSLLVAECRQVTLPQPASQLY